MTGWLIFLALAGAVGLALWRFGYPRALWTFAAAAITLGAAGYAWQGHPGLAGHPVSARPPAGAVDAGLAEIRDAMFGRFNFEYSYFAAADAMSRAGSPADAVAVMLGGVRKAPQDAALWTGLGTKLTELDGGLVSPAAKLAFDRAMALGPKHPGPPFFLGLAYIRAGRFAEALPWWRKALELTPEDASYRDQIAGRVVLLDRLLRMQAAAEKAQAPDAGS